MTTRHMVTPEFSLSEARRILGDLFCPRPVFYYFDFLVTILTGQALFLVVRTAPMITPGPAWMGYAVRVLAFIGCGLLFYRAAMFIHELVHLRSESMRGFRFLWNLLCGIPFLMPSFVYYTHIDHHRRKHYGTQRDGEYIPLAYRPRWFVFYYLGLNLVIPIAAFLRFLVLTPLAWIFPGVRRLVHRHLSSMVMDPTYIRPLPTKKTMRVIYLQEALCFLWLVGLFVVARVFVGRWPIPLLVQSYCIAVFVLTINSIRTLGAHRWHNDGHNEMTFVEQLLDSVNVHRSPWITELWGPIGTRYHALHHLFPSLPYHHLKVAHLRLRERLPADSPYHRTESPSLTSVLRDMWNRPRQVGVAAGNPGIAGRAADAPRGSDRVVG